MEASGQTSNSSSPHFCFWFSCSLHPAQGKKETYLPFPTSANFHMGRACMLIEKQPQEPGKTGKIMSGRLESEANPSLASPILS